MVSSKNAFGTIHKKYGQNLIGIMFNLFVSALTTQPHPLLPGGFHVEAEQKFLVWRKLRYEWKSIVWAKRVMDLRECL